MLAILVKILPMRLYIRVLHLHLSYTLCFSLDCIIKILYLLYVYKVYKLMNKMSCFYFGKTIARVCIPFFVFAVFILQTTKAQEVLSFNKHVHDFGVIPEDGNVVTATYIFTNISDSPLIITNIGTTCGCTTVHYPKTPIQPGKQDSIQVTYNPAGRPGVFNRTFSVFFNSKQKPFILRIKGTVMPGKARKHTGYVYVIGDLQLRNTLVRFNPLKPGVTRQQQSIKVINSGSSTLRVTFKSTDKRLSATLVPAELSPDGTGEIIVLQELHQEIKDTGRNIKRQAKQQCVRLSLSSYKDSLLELLLTDERCQ